MMGDQEDGNVVFEEITKDGVVLALVEQEEGLSLSLEYGAGGGPSIGYITVLNFDQLGRLSRAIRDVHLRNYG